MFLLSFNFIDHYQRGYPFLLEKLKRANIKYSFCGGRNIIELVTYNDKIVIPQKLQKYVLKWYHTYLLHPGLDRTEAMICQHFYQLGIREAVQKEVTNCEVCQRTKQSIQNGKLPAKLAKETPWNKLCVDLIGPYKICRKQKEPLISKSVTMIDPVTRWFEVTQYSDKKSMTIANLVETSWLVWYPWPVEITYEQGVKFLGHEFKKS